MKLSAVIRLTLVVVASTLVSSASIDKYESENPAPATVIHLLRTSESQNEKKPVEDSKQVDYTPEEGDDEYYYDDEEEEDEYELSGDFRMPKVAFSSKPKDPSTVLSAERTEVNENKGKGQKKGKGKGKKRNPCLRKYKNFCIHGTCQYLRKIGPSCVCNTGYSGERCHSFSLPVWTRNEGYNRTTALAVVAVVLSSLCLTIIGLLLALRFHKRGTYDVENEEKVKLEVAPHH
ncbi:heparin-binding EGF-like growth factor a [Hoplias malabaricus]|uniref:heparin-binding EGF-like growth factor a n=1 Tax=Hoplias malabaricus TaxID=27720 RepID=UPI0034621D18